ncbi:hypothetical protein D3Z38_19085 [Clostridiales bacterium]|nr:hypothetical protein [Clostridiales bacterium]
MKTALNEILRGLMRRSDAIGKVHAGTKLVDAVPSRTGTVVSEVALPSGTYVVTACVSWTKSEIDVLTVYSVDAGESRSLAVEARGTMTGGGGDCLSCVVTLGSESSVRLNAYHQAASTVPLSLVRLQAVRIK